MAAPQESFQNSPRVHELIRAGNLYLSLQDALALAIENNLDIELQRSALPVADAELLPLDFDNFTDTLRRYIDEVQKLARDKREQTVERSLRAPLELRNRPSQLELVEDPPSTVDVRVRGAASLLSQLTPSDVVAELDLSFAKTGRRYFPVTRAQVRVPFGVEVADITPGTISLRFEPSLSRRVPVVPMLDGEPARPQQQGDAQRQTLRRGNPRIHR